MKKVRVIKHCDGTYSIPLSTFTIKKPSYGGNSSKNVLCRINFPIDKNFLCLENK